MKNCNKTIPTIVEGNSLYEAVCVIKNVAEKAIAEAGTTATAAEEAKAAAEAAQQTANQAHEEATNAAASAEQASEKAQAAQTAADGAQQTANTASATANATAVKVDKVISGETVIDKYLVKETPAASPIVGDAVYVKNTGDAVIQDVMPICTDPQDLQYITSQITIAGRQPDTGDVYVPETPGDDRAATSKKYVDTAVTAVAAAPTTSLAGQAVMADESGTAVSQIVVQRFGISGFNGTQKKISYLDITGSISTNYQENTAKKLSFDITGVLGEFGNPGIDGKIPINVYSGDKARFTLAQFNASTGKMVIDCAEFDPAGGNAWQVFSQHTYYAT